MGKQLDRLQQNFAQELGWIRNPDIRIFVERIFDTVVPDYFWERPASKRGYHPEFVCGDGGLIRHVKYACWWGDQICRAFCGTGQNDDRGPYFDHVIAALICHDCVKDGDPGRTIAKSPIRMGNYHGVEMMEAIFYRVLNQKVENEDQVLIMQGIAAHMGVWTKPEEWIPANLKGEANRKVATLVHMADYNASRKVDLVLPALSGFQVTL